MRVGISLYPEFMDDGVLRSYIGNAAALGYRRVFLSFLLKELRFQGAAGPESPFFDRAIACCHEYGIQVTADVNDQVMDAFGAPEDAVSILAHRGLDVIRADSALPGGILNALARTGLVLELNAADLDPASPDGYSRAVREVERLLSHLPAGQVRGCFNFYPRTGTGLSLSRVRDTSVFLHDYGIPAAAFVSSLSAPPVLHDHGRGVCTVECLRDVPPEIAASALGLCGVDEVLFGDLSASQAELSALSAACADSAVRLPVVYCRDCPQEVRQRLAEHVLTNREDSPEYVLRATATRGLSVEPTRTGPRPRCSVTVDNSRSAQYRGEIQIMLRDMPACEEANVVGFIHPDAWVLLPLLSGHSFRLIPYE